MATCCTGVGWPRAAQHNLASPCPAGRWSTLIPAESLQECPDLACFPQLSQTHSLSELWKHPTSSDAWAGPHHMGPQSCPHCHPDIRASHQRRQYRRAYSPVSAPTETSNESIRDCQALAAGHPPANSRKVILAFSLQLPADQHFIT